MIMHQNNRRFVRGRDFCSDIIIKIHLIDCFEIIIVIWHCFTGKEIRIFCEVIQVLNGNTKS